MTANPFTVMEEAKLRLRRRVDDTIDIETRLLTSDADDRKGGP